MKTSIILHVAITSLIQEAAQHSSRAAPPLPGYGVEEMQWSFKPPFAEPIFINGTVQDVERSLEDTNTMRPEPCNEVVHPMAPGQERSVARDTMSVQFCGVFPTANSHHISAQIPAITTISGPAVIGPGPGNCVQVSCAQGSAIWWCNDRNTTIMLPRGMEQVGDAVDAIIDQCCGTTRCRMFPNFPISGQAFAEEKWNVLVKGEDC
ncbi:hypothetical protein INS49_009098 [Diaporthe citri]|uniref:uncharacterized protein n=1 Tax=Diaporthe citri TaxID=83186 RepID=UPI001C81D8E4|nr:uncharacterized protein INS49_009098 [Diaporthe citri]KAG6363995.1 hypothetical protein INS49_009098 [Diaporthe citri]